MKHALQVLLNTRPQYTFYVVKPEKYNIKTENSRDRVEVGILIDSKVYIEMNQEGLSYRKTLGYYAVTMHACVIALHHRIVNFTMLLGGQIHLLQHSPLDVHY